MESDGKEGVMPHGDTHFPPSNVKVILQMTIQPAHSLLEGSPGWRMSKREVKQLDKQPCGESIAEKTTLVITNLIACGNRLASVLRT